MYLQVLGNCPYAVGVQGSSVSNWLDNDTNPVPEMNSAITFSDQSTPEMMFLFYLCGHCDYIEVVMPNKISFKK